MGFLKRALLLTALVAGLPGAGRASFVVSPMEHHLRVPAGTRGTSSFLVRNTGQRALTLKIYLADSRFGPDGAEEDVALGTLERSCAPWLTPEEELVDLEPGAMKQVAVDLSPPPDARGSYWTKLYIEEVSTPEPIKQEKAGRSYQVFLRQRMGVRIFENVPGTEEPGAIVSRVVIDEKGIASRIVTLAVQNTGNSLLRCQGKVEVRNSRGEVVESMKPGTDGEFLVFPGAGRELSVTSNLPLPDDSYTVLAVVDYGGESLIAGEEIFQIGKPLHPKKQPPVATKRSKR